MPKQERETRKIGEFELSLTPDEYKFTRTIIGKIRRAGYTGEIKVIGSRAEGALISRTAFANETRFRNIPDKAADIWYEYLNWMASEHHYHPNELYLLIEELQMGTPDWIIKFLDRGDVSADLDLSISQRPQGIDKMYQDTKTGLVIDISTPEETQSI